MFEEGDKILLALSGGKDSMILSHILKHFSSVSPLNWEFHTVTVSYGIGENFTELKRHFIKHGITRGYLYTYALENGFNKIAIAHHLDDAAESFFMNLTYNGALRTLAPKYTAENGIVIIRPLILARERQIRDCAIRNEVPLMNEEESCPAKQYTGKEPRARAETKAMLANLEKENPKFFISLQSAFENIHKDTFF